MLNKSQSSSLYGYELSKENAKSIFLAAKKDGWTLHDIGSFSFVMARGESVLKIYCDEAYKAYINLATQEDNKHFPKIISSVQGKDICAVFMEKLEDIKEWNNPKIKAVYEYFDILAWQHWKSSEEKQKNVVEYKEKLSKQLGQEFVDACDTIYLLVENEKKNGNLFTVDLHEGNIMQNASGEYVLVDPLHVAGAENEFLWIDIYLAEKNK